MSSKGAAAEILTEDVATTEVRESKFREINLPLRRRVARRYLSARVGRNQQLQPGLTGGVPRHGGSQVPPGYFSELRHLPNTEFLSQYNINLARQVAMGSQLRLRSLQTVETEVHGLRNQTQNLETLLEAVVDMKKVVEAKSVDLTGRRWVIGHGLRLAIMKCAESTEPRQVFADVVSTGIVNGMSEGLKYGVEHEEAKLDLAAIEAYDPETEAKYVTALTALRDLKYPLIDQLEKLRDAPIDLLMASLHLESDYGEDALEWIRELRPGTSQSRAEKKKKYRVVCRTHGVGSAHHARSDGIPVSAPTIALQGLAILLADAAVQTEASKDEASPRLLRSKSLPPMYNLDWP
ncbi:hypothetical protein Tco_0755751 [Tanacetum coccineum]